MAKGALAHFKVISAALPPLTCPTAFCSPAEVHSTILATESSLGCYNENKLQKIHGLGI